jgi:hypothetical protein
MSPLHWSLIQTDLPGFPEVLKELFNPPAADLARYLGVHRRTVHRWMRTGCAPRAVVMALHRVSRPGLHQTHRELLRDLRAVDDWGLAMQRENDALRRELARVLAVGEFGAANLPVYRPGLMAADLLAAPPRVISSS